MKRGATLLLLLLCSCARPHHPSPYIPPETQYSTGSTLMAAGGLMTAMVGASFAQDPHASSSAKTAGTAAMAGGTAMMLASLIDAVEVQKEREKWINLTRAFYHHYYGGIDADESERPAPPALPEVPFTFKDPEPADDEP
jgi:hypothetical protein